MIKVIRGAISCASDTPEEISSCACELFSQLLKANEITQPDITFLLISHTKDLRALNSATALRRAGLCQSVPLFCVQEADITGALPHIIRMMICTEANVEEIHHIYLKEAAKLRPDLAKQMPLQTIN